MTLRFWGVIGMAVCAAIVATHALAHDTLAPAGPGFFQVAAAQPSDAEARDLLTSPRPRPAQRDSIAASGAAQSEQCRWLGTRIISLLSREDAMTAKHFNPFYDQFGCPGAHLSSAFGCVVGGGGPAEGEELSSRVDRCWANPADQLPSKELLGGTKPPKFSQEKSADGGT